MEKFSIDYESHFFRFGITKNLAERRRLGFFVFCLPALLFGVGAFFCFSDDV